MPLTQLKVNLEDPLLNQQIRGTSVDAPDLNGKLKIRGPMGSFIFVNQVKITRFIGQHSPLLQQEATIH